MGELYRLDFASGKSYIGITEKTAVKRFKGHADAVRSSRTNDTPLYNAWRKHGAPSLKVLAVIENYDLAETEIRAIKIFGTLKPNGYNLLEGGQVSPMTNPEVAIKLKGNKHTSGMKFPREEYPAKDAFYKSRKGIPLSETHLASFITAQNRPEAKEKLADRMRGDSNPMKDPATAAKQAAKMKGKKKTAEHALKSKHSITEAWKDPAFRENQVAKRKGKRHSDETIARMKVSQQIRRQKEKQK